MNSLFGTSGIRGSAKTLLTNQFCFDIGRSFAKFLAGYGQKGMVAVGQDSRESSPRIKKAFSLGLVEGGYKVVDQGITPVPSINYLLIVNPDFVGGCMITGSHIRSDFNGLKFFAFKEEILKKHEEEIQKIYEQIKEKVPFEEKGGAMENKETALRAYREMLLGLAKKPYSKWKVIVDAGNGCQGKIMPSLLETLGFNVITINNDLNPEKFIPRDTETEEAVKELQKAVRDNGADLGLAFDGDGDRVVFVDENERFIPGDYIGALIGKYSVSPLIVTPINTSQVVETIGKPVLRTKVGSPYVIEAMKKNKATFGFEANGGGISAEVMMSRDAGSTTIKILNLLKQTQKTLGELVDTLPRFSIYRTKVDCPRELNQTFIKRAKKEFKGVRTEEMDGLKIWLDDSSWLLFRPSSNAPEFRVFAEAENAENAEKIGKKGIDFIKSLLILK